GFFNFVFTYNTFLVLVLLSGQNWCYNSRCMCLQLETRIIPPHSLRSVEIINRGSHCKNIEVIAGLVSGERICLNPRTVWVKKLVHFIEKKKNETKKL
uniref:Chemokine interleukin-8-like domain-containing protein n=1 Tax=Electrophorus electricus TaxID=8005 RepID=A0A4W4GB87_ELEEL